MKAIEVYQNRDVKGILFEAIWIVGIAPTTSFLVAQGMGFS